MHTATDTTRLQLCVIYSMAILAARKRTLDTSFL